MMERLNKFTEWAQDKCLGNDSVSPCLYDEYGVNLGLRDENGNGVLTGLTNISKITSTAIKNGQKVPADGRLWYRGYKVENLISSLGEDKLGFERIAYLLLMGDLPDEKTEKEFAELIGACRTLPTNFTRDVIMKAPSEDIMNSMTRSILTLASYDDKAKDTSIANVLRQSIQLISEFPLLAVYGYNAYNHYEKQQSMFIHHPDPTLSTAENLLMLLRPDKKYSPVEAKVLDTALILHMEHGGGNNSTFTTHVVTSSGTDSYSSTAASIGSLKGPRHGGANLKVQNMFTDLKANVKDWESDEEITEYLQKVLNKEAFDHAGLIYGMGHAVYTLSDPREVILKRFAQALAEEKGMTDEFKLYDKVEGIAGKLIMEHRKLFKNVCANVDFYSGFVYTMLGIPEELFTPIFAIARMPGWSAHRLEELISANKIIRPAYKYVGHHKDYVAIEDRWW